MLIAIVAGVAAATANITCLTNAALATLIRLAGAAVVSSTVSVMRVAEEKGHYRKKTAFKG